MSTLNKIIEARAYIYRLNSERSQYENEWLQIKGDTPDARKKRRILLGWMITTDADILAWNARIEEMRNPREMN